jgi:hypothetical protein
LSWSLGRASLEPWTYGAHPEPSCVKEPDGVISLSIVCPLKKEKKSASETIWFVKILPAVLYWCETWSLTLREEYRLRVFKNRVLRRIFGPKRDEVTGGWRKQHTEELHNLYSSPSIRMIKSRRMEWEGHVARIGEKRNLYRTLVGKPQ